ncbi:MAG: hypothetical protein QOE05_3438 [Actinomycetota bacterium]|jgi:hypothetical protein|nr:hypothetical protein [Actinomycetota bacterium]
MRRRGAIAAVLLAALAAAPVAVAAPRTGSLVVSGNGGQSAVLTVPRGGFDVEYPLFTEQRLPGPDGAVGGVVIQRARDGRLVGGVVLQNAPGFDHAIPVPLADVEHTALRPGRYRFTLLGTGPQTVHLAMRRTTKARHVVAGGSGKPITRVVAGSAPIGSAWSDQLGRITSRDYVLVSAGSAGDLQQASEEDMCLQATGSQSPCLGASGFTVTPGEGRSGSWSAALYSPGDLRSGDYVFSGNAVAVGPGSTSAHAAVVIALPH